MLAKDASQLVIEDLGGLAAISRIISHAPSMSDLDGQPAHRAATRSHAHPQPTRSETQPVGV
jgi:hypothetical protein